MTFKYRPAENEDSPKLAELVKIASDGIVEYLFHDLVPGMTPVQVVAHNLENDNYPHSYRSAVVAAEETDVIGMALSYPSSYHKITKEKAVENGYNAMSLIVFADNELAIPVYKRIGFEIVQKIELRGNEFIKHEDGCLLMKCEITT